MTSNPKTPHMVWFTAFVHSADQARVAKELAEALGQHGYGPFDPFSGGSGTPLGFKEFVRHFVGATDPDTGWLRILGIPDKHALPDMLAALSAMSRPVVVMVIQDTGSGGAPEGEVGVWQGALPGLDAGELVALLRPGVSPGDLEAALSGTITTLPASKAGSKETEMLPGELGDFARERGVNVKQAANLIDRMAGAVFGKLDRQSGGEASAARAQARAMLGGGGPSIWDQPAGRRIASVAALLALPDHWRNPDFDAVRDAYQAARMLRRNPRANLMPAERSALNAVPDAGDYLPVYMGKP